MSALERLGIGEEGNLTIDLLDTSDFHDIPVMSEYFSLYWTGVLGPSSIAIARLIHILVDDYGETHTTIDRIASHVGLKGTGTHSPLMRSFGRMMQFGLARSDPNASAFRIVSHVPPLQPKFFVGKHPDFEQEEPYWRHKLLEPANG